MGTTVWGISGPRGGVSPGNTRLMKNTPAPAPPKKTNARNQRQILRPFMNPYITAKLAEYQMIEPANHEKNS